MAEEYYILEDGEKKGPYTFKELISEGIDLDTQVTTLGDETWQSASYLPEFAEYFASLGYIFPTEDNLAPVGSRTLAFIIDYVIISILAAIIVFNTGIVSMDAITKFDPKNLMASISVHTQILMELVFVGTYIIYNVLLESGAMRCSLGKRIAGLKVVDSDGLNLSFSKSLVRSIGAATGYVLFPIGLLVASVTFFTSPLRQTWYERITNSFVIRG